MRHPYRDPSPRPPEDGDATDDERPIAALLATIGLVPVVAALVAGGRFGAEPTIGLGIVALAAHLVWRRP